MSERITSEVVHSDGRVDLADSHGLESGRLYNADLAPVPVRERTWSTYAYAALWMGMAHGIPSYLLASGLITLGMNWIQAVLTIALGNTVVLVPLLLNSHAGAKYGIPFPVFARSSFGVVGANLPALLRALIACGWFGIQTWVGGQAMYTLVGSFAGDGWTHAPQVGGYAWTMWLSFAVFWIVQMALIFRGVEALRWFESWAGPAVLVVFTVLLVYMLVKGGGFGPILSQPSKLGWGADFWPVFFPSLMGMIAYFATLSLNMSDFTRFAAGQRKQALGQVLGLPTTMTFFSMVAVLTTSATVIVFGGPVWDPIELAEKFSNPIVALFSLFVVMAATFAANVAANTVGPSYDFSNAFPKLISFRTGGLITGVIGIVIQPWRLLSSPHLYIDTWLGFCGGLLGAAAAVLAADYWLVRGRRLHLAELYKRTGAYAYARGWNWRAVVAFGVGAVLALGGAHSDPGDGPFPVGGFIPALKPLYDFGWVIGFCVTLVLYTVLSRVFPADVTPAGDAAPEAEPETKQVAR
ncbi:MAG TPA: NCS1 family nucleobase:cation symporter-1 [Streptosporangiaceae bacterium]|jgi:NCS1 family nucleobase:cation symporter-1